MPSPPQGKQEQELPFATETSKLTVAGISDRLRATGGWKPIHGNPRVLRRIYRERLGWWGRLAERWLTPTEVCVHSRAVGAATRVGVPCELVSCSGETVPTTA